MSDTLEQAMLESELALADETLITPVNEYLLIDPETRLIEVPESESLFGVYSENGVEVKHFACPKIVLNNIDLSQMYIFINYVSASGRYGQTLAKNIKTSEDGNYITFDWELTGNVFDLNTNGKIYFAVMAKKQIEDKKPVFATRKASGDYYETIEAGEVIQEQHADIILEMLTRIEALENGGTVGSSFSGKASDVTYDDTETKLGADNVQDAISKVSEEIADKATVENGVVKVWKSATEDGGTDTLLYTIDLSSIGSGLDLNNLTLSVSQVGEYQRLFMSDGTTTKTVDIPITAITDEQVQTAVETWLSEHPEATTTVADGSITEAKLADGAVSMNKTSFISFDGYGENLFNKDTATDGYRLELYNATKVVDGYSISDYIPVEANTTYSYINTTLRRVQFFDSAKSFLSGVNASKTFTTVENCAFIRIEFSTTEKDAFMVVEGDTLPSEYVPYVEYYKLNDSVKIGVSNIQELTELFSNIPQNTITTEMFSETVQLEFSGIDSKVKTSSFSNDVRLKRKQLSGRINVFENVAKGKIEITSDISDKTIVVHGVNYFDKDDLVQGSVNNSTGAFIDKTTDYRTKNFIPVEANKKMYWNRNNTSGVKSYLMIWFYDKDKNYLSYKTIGGATNADNFTTPENACFMIVGCGGLIDASLEKLCIADVDVGNTHYGNYDGDWSLSGNGTYFGKNVYVPYIGYRIENGVLVGASELFTVEEVMHVDVFEADSTIEVSVPIAEFDQEKLKNVQLKFGRYANTDYVMARIFKSTISGGTITPKLIVKNPGGIQLREYAKNNDFIMGINAGSFDTNDNSCIGTTIADGIVITDHLDHMYVGACDVLTIDTSGNLKSYPYETTTEALLSSGVIHAVQGKGTLITAYEKNDLETYSELLGSTANATEKHPRTVIGQFKNGDYMVFTCGGRETNQAGMTCGEMQELFVSEGLKYAYNLDGGGSCNMWFYKKELAPYTEKRADPTHIVFN